MSPFSTTNRQTTILSPINHCLSHSLTHSMIKHWQQFRLSTHFYYDYQHLIAIAQPNFQQNGLFSLHFPFISSGVLLQTPFFWSGVAHRNCTTLLALKRFLCGYEACHLSTTKVRSPQLSCKFPSELQCRSIVLSLYQRLPPTTVKSPCCPILKDVRHYPQNLLVITNLPHKKLIPALYQFHYHFYTLSLVQPFPAVTNKEASSLFFKARS